MGRIIPLKLEGRAWLFLAKVIVVTTPANDWNERYKPPYVELISSPAVLYLLMKMYNEEFEYGLNRFE